MKGMATHEIHWDYRPKRQTETSLNGHDDVRLRWKEIV